MPVCSPASSLLKAKKAVFAALIHKGLSSMSDPGSGCEERLFDLVIPPRL